jgi:hypothetical protein
MYSHKLSVRLMTALGLLAAPLMDLAQAAGGAPNGIRLLEPIGGVTVIPTDGMSGLGVFGLYFNLLYPWIVGLGAAIALLMGLVGGIQIMTAGGDPGKRSAGMNRLFLSVGGLVFLLFSATILNILNPTFFH